MASEFSPEDLTEDGFLDGRLRILQPRTGYRAAMDPVLLAAAVPATAGQTVLELGCGAGVASLCLGHRVAGLRLFGLELQADYAALARQNAVANGIVLDVHVGDLAAVPKALRAVEFDHVIANPPYFADGSGTAAENPGREIAQREATPLSEWVATALRRLKPGGWLTLIQSADRLPDLFVCLAQGVGNTTLLPIAPRQGRAAGRIILRCRKGGRGPFTLAAPFILHDGTRHLRDGDDQSAAARAVLRDGAALAF